MKSLLLAFLTLLAMPAVAQKKLKMIVHEEPKDCRRMIAQTCLQVKIDDAAEWSLFYDEIRGFDYEPGYRYEIIVIETPNPEPVAPDLPRYSYRLEKIISKNAAKTTGSLNEPSMKVISINGLQSNSDNFYFQFSEDSTMVSGKSGCNAFSMPVTFNKSRTKFTTQAATSTMIACSEEVMKEEMRFLNSIQNKKFKLRKSGNQVIWKKCFKNVLVTEQFTPSKGIVMDGPWNQLDGKVMKVIQLNGRGLRDTKASITFDSANGRFSGNSGCNQVSGNFHAKGTGIYFSSVASTKMACTDENMNQTESEVLAILNAPGLSYDVAERVLNIYDGTGKLVMILAR